MELHYPQEPNGRYILRKADIEEIADNALQAYFPDNLIHTKPLDTAALFEELGLLVKHAYIGVPGHEILGVTVMDDRVEIPGCDTLFRPVVFKEDFGNVLISTTLCDRSHAPRRRYTEAHEISHWLLHRPYFEKKPGHAACRKVEMYRPERRTELDWVEWQADTLAASLLMPRDTFYSFTKAVIKNAGIRKGYLTEGDRADKTAFHEEIAPVICQYYFVSKRAAQIRMLDLGLIKRT